MRTLVVGANGLLGSTMVGELGKHDTRTIGTYHSAPPAFDIPLVELDITDGSKMKSVLNDYDVETVINCAAVTDVDGCESASERAFAVNGSAPGELAEACEDRGISFVHVSTDYVFDGTSSTPYDEQSSPSPIQVYGESKLAGERAVREADSDALIVRLSFVYGRRGDTGDLIGFPSWVRETLRAGDTVPLFTDQRISPSRTGQVAQTIHSLVQSQATGTFHVASRSCVTPYEFGRLICKEIEADEDLLLKSRTDDLNRPAERPRNSCLAASKVEARLNRVQPDLRDDLREIEIMR